MATLTFGMLNEVQKDEWRKLKKKNSKKAERGAKMFFDPRGTGAALMGGHPTGKAAKVTAGYGLMKHAERELDSYLEYLKGVYLCDRVDRSTFP
ncbi:hypothetical protein [Spirillospora sp. NPDC047279]|uniref:hypothetical protein n=1 Tax=Spirillospora sp. NPDC047279 TaxID=3155478 RepID=UPI0033FB06BE